MVDFQDHLSEGSKKNGTFTCHRILDNMKEMDSENN